MGEGYAALTQPSGLPWERVDGLPSGTGICLSGGGLRAASFALGVLQALQERRGLLFGETSAQYLAAVSGGSYIAASHLLEASRQARVRAEEPWPLTHGSPEESHILAHAWYLCPQRWRFAGLALLNLLAFGVLFVWTGLILGDWAVIVSGAAKSVALLAGLIGTVNHIPL